MVVLDRLVHVGERLRLDALRRVHHQQRALARGEAAADFIGEIDVAGRVHQVERIGLAIVGRVGKTHGLRLDGDATLLLDVHVIKHLLGHFARRQPACLLDQAIRERGFPVIDVGDY